MQRHLDHRSGIGILIMLAGIMTGLFIGEANYSLDRLSLLTSWLVTISAAYFGLRVLIISIKTSQWLLSATVMSIFAANVLFSLSVEPEAAVNMLFDLATFLSLIVISKYAEEYSHVCNHCGGRIR